MSGDKLGSKDRTLAALNLSFPFPLPLLAEADFLTPFVDFGLFVELFGRPFFGADAEVEEGRGGLKGLGGIVVDSSCSVGS